MIAVVLAALFTIVPGPWEMPPKEYDHEPRRPAVILRTHLLSISFACGVPVGHFRSGERRIEACSYVGLLGGRDAPRCLIILPYRYEVGAEEEDRDYRHERAHCNGWRHPDE